MITPHPSEEELQQYISDPKACAGSVIEHIGSCEACLQKTRNYRILFAGIRQQPRPQFDFDLAEFVIARLVEPKPIHTFNSWGIYFYSLLGLTCVLTLSFLFHEYLAGLFIRYSNLLLYMFIATTAIVLLFQCIEICGKYRKQIRVLDVT
jgi:hypothetical protein